MKKSKFSQFKKILRHNLAVPYNFVGEIWRKYRKKRFIRIIEMLTDQHGFVVQSGPFAGMVYVNHSVGSTLAPKLLGSYEAELHETIEKALHNGYEQVIDIGSAEGYYAIGCARKLPDSIVYAFDINSTGRSLCKQMAEANGVANRVVIQGECSIEILQKYTVKSTLVICDCEGCEFELLKPELIPGLKGCDLLVELHDMLNPAITPSLVERFSPTHEITLITSQKRDPSQYRSLDSLGTWDRHLAVDELRQDIMQWAFMKSKTPHSTPA
ncbi:hypothetical protein [Laspinema olomoucense]|uniref:hypothetical protein n=1 Tax=Laspinema olomoucense TaxID=3231600 RepID=UPI0021BAC5D8|nr:hypothetical protein [Laspinema sp. D3a]MCT7990842.1 hypothetical protein [Laspinema sp. D3a]